MSCQYALPVSAGRPFGSADGPPLGTTGASSPNVTVEPPEGPRARRTPARRLARRLARAVLLPVVIAVGTFLGARPLEAQQRLEADDYLDNPKHAKFEHALPIPARIDLTRPKGNGLEVMTMRETTQWLGLEDGAGNPLLTTVWGYGRINRRGSWAVSSPGPTLVAHRDRRVRILWQNELPPYNTGFPGLGGHLLPVDPSVHIAHPMGGGIPTVTHLHGGHTESASDGLPEAWFTQGFAETGPEFVKEDYAYDNDQEAATLWYHDHALGITRLNVYAGLAGFYLLRDENEEDLVKRGVLPGGPYEIEVAIQDRAFTTDGQLYVPHKLDEFYDEEELEDITYDDTAQPSALPEFFGDFIMVNGMIWPHLEVEPRTYRFRMLNGSDSRFYVLEFRDDELAGIAQPFLQIGTDVGLLPFPVELTRLVLGPGERADLVVDFSGLELGAEIYLRNFGPDEPFGGLPVDEPADVETTGQIMRFDVSLPLNEAVPIAETAGERLRPDIAPLGDADNADHVRQLVLFEGTDNYGRLQPMLGTLADGSLTWSDAITENPMVDDVEVWEVYNATADAHPIHLHLVAFQILSRQPFDGEVEEKPQLQHDGTYGVGGVLTEVELEGVERGPEANEAGWKDTAIMLPGEVTRVVARFDREGRYVWHCHILSHEDHEMMRPYFVGPMDAVAGAARSALASAGVGAPPDALALESNWPNPFARSTEIRFRLPEASAVRLAVYDVLGREVARLVEGDVEAGEHVVAFERSGLAAGVYVYRLTAGTASLARQMVLLD